MEFQVQRVPALRVFWDLEKTVLHETRVSGTVLWSPLARKLAKNCGSGNRVSDFRISGGPPVVSAETILSLLIIFTAFVTLLNAFIR